MLTCSVVEMHTLGIWVRHNITFCCMNCMDLAGTHARTLLYYGMIDPVSFASYYLWCIKSIVFVPFFKLSICLLRHFLISPLKHLHCALNCVYWPQMKISISVVYLNGLYISYSSIEQFIVSASWNRNIVLEERDKYNFCNSTSFLFLYRNTQLSFPICNVYIHNGYFYDAKSEMYMTVHILSLNILMLHQCIVILIQRFF